MEHNIDVYDKKELNFLNDEKFVQLAKGINTELQHFQQKEELFCRDKTQFTTKAFVTTHKSSLRNMRQLSAQIVDSRSVPRYDRWQYRRGTGLCSP